MAYRKNPIGVFLYCMMQAVGYPYSYFYLIDKYCPGPHLSEIHKPLSLCVVLFCWSTYIYVLNIKPLDCKEKMRLQLIHKDMTGPGERYEEFPYDGVQYVKGQECRTCKIPKLARSKHCSICNTCFDYFDHHCIWVNACVTRTNLFGFILFVFSHACLCIYGSYVFMMVLLGQLSKVNDTKMMDLLDWQNGFSLGY